MTTNYLEKNSKEIKQFCSSWIKLPHYTGTLTGHFLTHKNSTLINHFRVKVIAYATL